MLGQQGVTAMYVCISTSVTNVASSDRPEPTHGLGTPGHSLALTHARALASWQPSRVERWSLQLRCCLRAIRYCTASAFSKHDGRLTVPKNAMSSGGKAASNAHCLASPYSISCTRQGHLQISCHLVCCRSRRYPAARHTRTLCRNLAGRVALTSGQGFVCTRACHPSCLATMSNIREALVDGSCMGG